MTVNVLEVIRILISLLLVYIVCAIVTSDLTWFELPIKQYREAALVTLIIGYPVVCMLLVRKHPSE